MVCHRYRKLLTCSTRPLIDRIEQEVNLPVYNFPKLQTFYLGLWLHLDADDKVSTIPVPGPLKQGGMMIDELDRKIVQATQAGLPLQDPQPYTEVADACGYATRQTVIQRMQRMLNCGVSSVASARFPITTASACMQTACRYGMSMMTRLLELGSQLSADSILSAIPMKGHVTLPLWPYNLFAMIHGHDREEVMQKQVTGRCIAGF